MRNKQRLRRRAGKLPAWAQDVAATRAYPYKGYKRHRDLGASFGAASGVRRIDPKDYGP